MKKVKYFIFSLICLFSCGIVFAKDEVVIKSITPVYDKTSSIVVSNENNNHSVTFNDKDQSIKYKVVLENTADYEVQVSDINLTTPTEKFLIYKVEGINTEESLKSKESKEFVVSLKTVKTEGWGRNFNDELIATINFEKAINNPDTNSKGLIIILIVTACITLIITLLCRKSMYANYLIIVFMISSLIPITNALNVITVPIKVNAAFESQNVSMAQASETVEICIEEEDYCYMHEAFDYFWKHNRSIINIYIEDQITEIENYEYKYDVSEKQNGKVIAYLVDSVGGGYDLYIQSDGILYFNNDASYYFAYMECLKSINGLENVDTSNVTNMEGMFLQAGKERPEFTLDLGDKFDTSKVTNMHLMFSSTGYSNPNFTLDLGDKFDTSNVTDMSYMFDDTGYNSTVFTLDLGDKFDTSNVTNMDAMFYRTGYNSPIFTLDLGDKFDTSKVTNMHLMFSSTGYSNPTFTLDLGDKFDTSSVTTMQHMFGDTGYNSTVFTLDLGDKFDTSNVTDMYGLFSRTGYNSPVFTLDLGDKFDTSNVTDMSHMFSKTGYTNPKFTLDLGDKFDTSNVKEMGWMFDSTGYNSTVFTLDLGDKFNTSKVTDIQSMFENTGYNSPIFTLDVSNFDTSNVIIIRNMFKGTGYNSTKLNTSITIRRDRGDSKIFIDVATKPGSQITVNYTSTSSSYVDKIIANKSSNSNVVKGVQVD